MSGHQFYKGAFWLCKSFVSNLYVVLAWDFFVHLRLKLPQGILTLLTRRVWRFYKLERLGFNRNCSRLGDDSLDGKDRLHDVGWSGKLLIPYAHICTYTHARMHIHRHTHTQLSHHKPVETGAPSDLWYSSASAGETAVGSAAHLLEVAQRLTQQIHVSGQIPSIWLSPVPEVDRCSELLQE